jgi:hypothetical protein
MERKVGGVFDDDLDLDTALHPSQLFEHPSDVVDDPDLSLNEKRAILASWASDACAVESAPTLRKTPRGRNAPFDEIMDALRLLDKEAYARPASVGRQRVGVQRWRVSGGGGTSEGHQGSPVH